MLLHRKQEEYIFLNKELTTEIYFDQKQLIFNSETEKSACLGFKKFLCVVRKTF